MGRITRYFFEGLLFLVPVVATVYVVYLVFAKIDGIFKFPVPGVGFLLTLLTITMIGFVTSNVLTRGITRVVDVAFGRLPLVKMVYTAVKDLIGAFVGDKKSFDRPVAVTLLPGSSLRVIGFVTSGSLENLGLAGDVAVYLPQSYNFAGNLIVVPENQVTPIEGESGDIMAFIVSGGITTK
jgi:uncharacterized membrane protein